MAKHTFYTVCYTCRKVWCNSTSCETPKCKGACEQEFDEENVKYDFCGSCKKTMTTSFESQMRKRLSAPVLRIEIKEEPKWDSDDAESDQ